MGFQPVLSPPKVRSQRHLHGVGALHLFDDNLLNLLHFLLGHAEIEFVVDLEDKFCFQIVTLEALIDACHGHFDDIGSTARAR